MVGKINERQFLYGAWILTGVLCGLAFIVFGQSLRWNFERLSAYRLFPLFGLLAFSIFLSHYVVATIRQMLDFDKALIKQYYFVTSLVALGVMLLHPSLLIGKLFADGFGLPPGSYLNNYVAPSLKWAAAFGSLSLFLFLSYELTRLKVFERWKPVLQGLSDIAMILIFFHGLALGRHLQSGWFRPIWLVYGLVLLVCLVYGYMQKFNVIQRGENS